MRVLLSLRDRFWFLPAVLCLGAFVLAELLVTLDERITLSPPGWVTPFLFQVGESGSRDLLGTIGASALAVAGTTFSITMAVLALTSSTYGPRLVRNFMADRSNQLVLGVFVATFLYSLLVLRSVRVPGDPGSRGEVFVPHVAVNVAVLLAVLNVAVLVFFIHHISDSIQVATLASAVRGELRRSVDRLYPDQLGHDADTVDRPADEGLPQHLAEQAASVRAGRSGYVQVVREEALLRAARRHDVLLALRVRPGSYVLDDTVLALVHPAPDPEHRDAVAETVRRAFTIANARSPRQDVEFAVQQLTEMAVRALSPGTNDPYTAVNALDDVSSGLSLLAQRRSSSPSRYDDDGVLRVHAPRPALAELVTGVLDAVRWYGAKAPSVMHTALQLVERVGTRTSEREVRARLLTELTMLRAAFGAAGHHAHDVALFEQHADAVQRRLVRVGD